MQNLYRRQEICLYCFAKNVRSFSSAIAIYQKAKLKEDVDWVGPPDPDSNIRKIVYSRRHDGDDDSLLDDARQDTYEWNNNFWRSHNKKFFEEKRKFIEDANVASGKGQDVSDRLSIFYKDFLENNHQVYMDYNREWYRRNFRLLWLSWQSFFSNMFGSKKEKS